jgi:hypothetical protein
VVWQGTPQDIPLTPLAERVAKLRVAPQFIIAGDPAIRHLFPPHVEHLQALFLPCLIAYLQRHMACLASWLVACPVRGQRQAEVKQGMVVARDVAHEDPDLAVVHLAPVAAPLALHAHRMRPALGEATGIESDDAIGFAQPLGHLADQHGHQRTMIPGHRAEEVLDDLALDRDERRDVLRILPG